MLNPRLCIFLSLYLNTCEETKHGAFVSRVQDESLLPTGGVSKVERVACSIVYAWLGAGAGAGVLFRMEALWLRQ